MMQEGPLHFNLACDLNDRTYYFTALTTEEREQWISVIRGVIAVGYRIAVFVTRTHARTLARTHKFHFVFFFFFLVCPVCALVGITEGKRATGGVKVIIVQWFFF